MAKGKDASEFFADVIKNIASSSLETRKLVYIYLLRYADYEPDLALLSINTIQKSLADQNPVIRALAVRVISAIRVPVIAPIVQLAIRQCCNDLSATVRRATVQAIGKCYDLDPSSGFNLLETLSRMLVDRDNAVLSSSLVVLGKYFPDRLDLLHTSFRSVCRRLSQLDEWSQVSVLELLIRYSRLYLSKPRVFRTNKREDGSVEIIPIEEEEQNAEAEEEEVARQEKRSIIYDPDLELLFNSVNSLLFSRNGAVILSTAKLYFYLGTKETFHDYDVAEPIVRLLRSDSSVQYIALLNIRTMALTRTQSFVAYLSYFYVLPSDNAVIAKLKFEILTLLVNDGTINSVLNDIKFYAVTSNNSKIVSYAMQAIARCALKSKSSNRKIISWLLSQINSDKPIVVSEALTCIRLLIQNDATNHISTVARLANYLDNKKQLVSNAKASIIWLVGEFSGLAYEIAPDVLRKCIKSFAYEDEFVRYQIVVLAAKVYSYYLERTKSTEMSEISEQENRDSRSNEMIPKLFSHVMWLAKYDSSYDTRDRARMFTSLLNSSINNDLAFLILQAPKPIPIISVREKLKDEHLQLGTVGLALGHFVDGHQDIPQWDLPENVDPTLREEESATPAVVERERQSPPVRAISSRTYKEETHGLQTNGKKKLTQQTLDEFLGDVKEESEEDSEEESEDEEEEEESEEEEEEDEEDEEEEEESEESESLSPSLSHSSSSKLITHA